MNAAAINSPSGESSQVFTLLNAASILQPSEILVASSSGPARSFMASVTGSAAAATVTIEVSNDGVSWLPYIVMTPALGTPDGYADFCPWPYVRANPSSITGLLTVTVGC